MSWSMSFETTSEADLRKHAEAYASTLRDAHQAAQVPVAVDEAVVLAEALGAGQYLVQLSGHAAKDEPTDGDSLTVHVTRKKAHAVEKASP